MAMYGYVRVSTLAQAEEGESLEIQQRKIEGRALELGKAVDRVFVERGVSGSKPLERRPEGKKLKEALKPGDTVIASKLDRMFRSADDALRIISDFRRRKISLYLLDLGGDCTGDGIAKLVFTILSGVAEFERDRIRERIAEVKAEQRRRGRHLGGSRQFGFKIDHNGALRPVTEEQRAIRAMRNLHTTGHSLREIAQRVEHQFGITISHMTVQAILRREAGRFTPARGCRPAAKKSKA